MLKVFSKDYISVFAYSLQKSEAFLRHGCLAEKQTEMVNIFTLPLNFVIPNISNGNIWEKFCV